MVEFCIVECKVWFWLWGVKFFFVLFYLKIWNLLWIILVLSVKRECGILNVDVGE